MRHDPASGALVIMLKHQSQDLHHLPIATGAGQQVVLQSLESLGQFQEWGPLRRAPGFRWITAR